MKVVCFVQAEYGDWHEKSRDFIPEVYLASKFVKSLGKDESRRRIRERYEQHEGMPDHVAEVKFFKVSGSRFKHMNQ